MRRKAGGEQRDEPCRYGEQAPRGDRDEPIECRDARQCAERQSGQSPGEDVPAGFARGENAVEKQRHLGALAQHGQSDDGRQREERLVAARHRPPDVGKVLRQLAPMLRHPDVVPDEHDDGDREDRGVKELLPAAGESLREPVGESGDDNRAQRADSDAGRDEAARAGDAASHGQNDANDETGFDGLAEDDDERAEHGYSAMTSPLAVLS